MVGWYGLQPQKMRVLTGVASDRTLWGKTGPAQGTRQVQREMNVLALVKNSERYVFLYDDDSTEAVLQKLGQYAADKDLSFSWYDAAVLSQKVRRLKEEAVAEKTTVSSTSSHPSPVASEPAPEPARESVPLPGLRFRGIGRMP